MLRGRGVLAQDRAEDSFEAFVRVNYGRVLGLVIAVYGRRDAEDVVQEAFERAQGRWERVVSLDRGDLWVRRVALNLAASRLRRWRIESAALLRLRARSMPVTVSLSSPTAEVWDHVRRLSTRQAQVVALRYLEELTTAEIATVLGIAEGTVRALLHQGRTRLAQSLGEEAGGSEEED